MHTNKCARLITVTAMIYLLLMGCTASSSNPAPSILPTQAVQEATTTKTFTPAIIPPPTATVVRATATATPTEKVAESVAPEGDSYPLSMPGPYFVGKRKYEFEAARVDKRPSGFTVWYPALLPEGSTGAVPVRDAMPDLSGAPYALILSTTKIAGIFAPYLVSHGFAWVSVNGLDTYLPWNAELIEQPLDILFALEHVANNPPEGLEGVIDTEHAGAIGYSFDGYNALALSGARVDPDFYLSSCDDAAALSSAPVTLPEYACAPATQWEQFMATAGDAITTSEDGLWQAMTDERIRAVIPLAGEGWWLFGEKGLAAIDRPVMLVVSTNDGLYAENVQIFDHLAESDRTLVSFIGQGHMMIYENEMIARMAHFAVAFFGYHLQGQEDLAQYFSQEFVEQHEDLAWGAYVIP